MDVVMIGVFAVLAVVAVTQLAPRIRIAAPLLLVVLGIVVSFLPVVAPIQLQPEWILGGILPPLLYSSAVNLPTMEFRRDFRVLEGESLLNDASALVPLRSAIAATAVTVTVREVAWEFCTPCWSPPSSGTSSASSTCGCARG